VEIFESVGEDNIFIFGLNASEVEEMWAKGYYATYFYSNNPEIKRIVDFLKTGFYGGEFSDIAHYLTTSGGISDPYMCLADFESYMAAHKAMDAKFKDKKAWANMSLVNISEAGRFAADRSIRDYADNIWNLKPVR
jgi:starch phosphorylase